jgi:hypothetical protein
MITAKVDPIGRDLSAALADWFGPAARADILTEAARDVLAGTDAKNTAALGEVPAHETFVDGIRTEAIDGVRADGVIVRTYDVMPMVLAQIAELLWTHSPVRTGRYEHSHHLFADGRDLGALGEGGQLPALPAGVKEFMFASVVFYAEPIERGVSRRAPDGVYQVVAAMVQQDSGDVAKISFGYREADGLRQPAITVVSA